MMEAFSQFHFIRPGWLWLLPLVGGLWWLWRGHTTPLRGWREQIAPELLQAMTVRNTTRQDYSALMLLVGWLLAVVAIAGPTWKQEPNPFAADAAPLMILLKADKSMDQPDPLPSAIERARLKVDDLVRIRQGQPVGLIAYAGSAHLVLPPTRDTSIVAEMAAQISSGIMPEPGDRLDLALEKADEILKGGDAGGTVLVMADSVTDDTASLVKAGQKSGAFPIQFLALRNDPSLQRAAEAVQASLVELTPDDADVTAIAKAAERKSVVGVAGEDPRWEEMGYWLVPFLVVIVAVGFRREKQFNGREVQ
ncbi:MAG: VWA domain-containing protein [Gimesia chilikensis]|uniref:VWA domain-containing protein n=1 Tax=Gimesia chilikensis TaxID=2605989 RepID=UPI00379DF413